MAKRRIPETAWFPMTARPVRSGWYEILPWVMPFTRRGDTRRMAYWTGTHWNFYERGPSFRNWSSDTQWRGLTEQSK